MLYCRSVVLLALCFFLFVTLSSGATNCSSGVEFIEQPPPFLSCNPAVSVALSCQINVISGLETEVMIKWNYAGLSNGFNVSNSTIPSNGVRINTFALSSQLSITNVNEDTYGLYWCTVDGYSTPSTVTPICPSLFNASLPSCTTDSLSENLSLCVGNETSSLAPNVTDDIRQQCLSLIPTSSTIDISSSSTQSSLTGTASDSVILSSSIITPQLTSNATLTPNVGFTSTIPEAAITTRSISTTTTTTVDISSFIITNTTRNGGLPSSSPALLESPNPNQTTASTNGILIGLIIVCILLGCIAVAIVSAIAVLCFLTRRGKLDAGSAGDDHGTKPPTVEPISRYEETSPIQDGTSQSTNDSPHLQTPDEQNVSFVNPVYEISVTGPSAQPRLSPPKNLPPTDYYSSPPIFSDDVGPNNKHGRSYYAKPDMSKKRSQSIPAQDKSTTVSPTPPIHSPTPDIPPQVPNITNEVVYDTPVEEPDNDTAYAKPTIPIPAPSSLAAPVKHEPSYEDPWENLPSAIKRSRESTRSHQSNAPTNSNNNNKKKPLFDDPTYDIPSV